MQTAVISKHFITHKRGETDADIQDSICLSDEKGRYALSDGVSMSFLPRVLADILTESFVHAPESISSSAVLASLFEERQKAYLDTLDETGWMLQDIAKETFKHAAATFINLELRDQRATWKVLGDSCLFILPDGGAPQCICSDSVKVSDDGRIHVLFGSHPAQINSDGQVFGKPITGSDKMIESGWYVLMSDAISEWFIKQFNEGNNMAPTLFRLNSNDEFEKLIEQEYQGQRMRSDDCSVILIRINGIENAPLAEMVDVGAFEEETNPKVGEETRNTAGKNEWDDHPAPDYFTAVQYSDDKQSASPCDNWLSNWFCRMKNTLCFWKNNNDTDKKENYEELPECDR